MKKLMRKLVLSSFALGLAVITLSTTTFAWYTANTDVTADGVSSVSSAAGSDLLMITQYVDRAQSALLDWQTSISEVRMDATGEMVPLKLVGAEYKSLQDNAGTEYDAQTTGYIEFTLCFKNAGSGDLPLYVNKFEILNITKSTFDVNTGWSTPTLPTKDIIQDGRGAMGTWGSNKVSDDTDAAYKNYVYSVDVLRTLMVTTTATRHMVAGNETVYTVYNTDDIVTPNADNYQSTWNAHDYYNSIMETQLTGNTEQTYDCDQILKADSSNDEKLVITSVPSAGSEATKGQYVSVTFRVFINGWDLACFDACKEQTIHINLSFTTSTTDNERLCVSKHVSA